MVSFGGLRLVGWIGIGRLGDEKEGQEEMVAYACDADACAEMAIAPDSRPVQAIQYLADVGGKRDQHLRSLAAHAHQSY